MSLPRRMLIVSLVLGLAVAGCGVSKQRLNDAKVHYTLGVSYLGERNATQALKEFLLAERANPDDADIQAALGQAYHLKNSYALAEEHYLRALDLDENNPRYMNNLGALYLDAKRYDEAIRHFRAAAENLLAISPETSLAGIGYAHYLKGDYVAAVNANQEAIARNPRYALAQLRLGEALFALGRDEEALRAYRQAQTLAPNDANVNYRLGLVYFKLKQRDKAANAFNEVVRLAPDSELAGLSREYLKMLK